MATSYTIEQFLRGKVDFNVTDATMMAILYDREVEAGSDMSVVTEKQKDLCLADLYMFVATSSTTSSGEYESDGGWQHQKSAKNVYDREAFKKMAQELYAKWDDKKADSTVGRIVLKPLY